MPVQFGSGSHSGAAILAQRLLRQGLQLGLVGLLTGLAGSAAAHQLARWQRHAAAKQLSDCSPQDANTLGGGSGARGQPAAEEEQRPHAHVLQRSAMQRVLFMGLSANVRHAALYAAEDRMCMHAGAPVVVHTARVLLYGANSLLAAAQWRRVSGPIYAGR
jgi:hypothetical protein